MQELYFFLVFASGLRLSTLLFLSFFLISCGGNASLSAEEKRNNFDACKITFIKEVPESRYNESPEVYEKQAEQGCAILLTADKAQVEVFVQPKPSLLPEKPKITFDQVCEKIKRAAYAHREFKGDPEYDVWYGRIRSYFSEAASLMRQMSGNFDSLIADAEFASTTARGVNAGSLLPAEARLYAACKISEDAVMKDLLKWIDGLYG